MPPRPILEVRLGDVLTLKKRHPCGSLEWAVTRVGAEIRVRCLGCDRMVPMLRSELERRVKAVKRIQPRTLQ